MDHIFQMEKFYIEQFCTFTEHIHHIHYKDELITDMYMHNFILIKNEDVIVELVKEAISKANHNFVRFEYNGLVPDDVLEQLPVNQEVTEYDIMSIDSHAYTHLNCKTNCTVKEANTDELFNLAVSFETEMETKYGDFTLRKINRKIRAYKEGIIKYFICFHQNIPVGACELTINGHLAKIEEFGVLEQYQRKGFGTCILRHLLKVAYEQGVKMVYLITDGDDTAKEMYSKCGFKKIGVKTELFFRLK